MARVLVVDDEAGIRETAARFLAAAGHDASVADDVAGACALLARADFDVVLTDIVMQKEDGLALLRIVRESCPHTQVVLFTGQPSVETAAEAVRLGAFDYLSKPLLKGALCAVVDRAASTAALRRDNARMSEQIRRYSTELETLVARRTEDLHRREVELERAQAIGHLGSWSWDVAGDRMEWSAEMHRLHGTDPATFKGTLDAFVRRIHPADLPRGNRAIHDLLAGRPFVPVEYRVVRADGDEREVRMEGADVERDAAGRPLRVFGTALDITDRRRHERQIEAFSSRLLSVREEERKRLSAALHHDLGSLAVGVSSRLEAARSAVVEGRSQAARDCLDDSLGLLRDAVARLKRVAFELRPPDLDLLGLTAALRQHMARISSDAGLRIAFADDTGGQPVEAEAAVVLFRIGQEALTNVARHAGATRVAVKLVRLHAAVRLTVRDNGRGFDVDGLLAAPGVAMGLVSMREMARSVGGTVGIESRPGRGASVVVTVPVPPAGRTA